MNNINYRIVVLCNYPFPDGMAATTRIFAYAKGMNRNGIGCEVLTFCSNPHNGSLSGIKNDVKFHHSHAYNPNGNKFYRVFIDLNLFRFYAILFLIRENRKNKIDYILISFDSIKHLIYFVPILKLLGFSLGFVSDEFPPEIRKLKSKISSFNNVVYKLIHHFFKFRLTMTKSLRDYFNTQFLYKPTFLLNTIVDVNRFANLDVCIINSNLSFDSSIKLCYMGNMELAKDNVDNIIYSISLLKNKYPYIQFDLYGTPNKFDQEIILNLITNLNLHENVRFKGRIDYDLVPVTLKNYNLLVSSQPNTVRAQGGFPTKLGEYLMTGIPVLLTRVGEIDEYIIDGINGFLVDPCDPVKYADKIDYIINNYSLALNVAKNGRDFVLNSFSSDIVLCGFDTFLNKL